jgi:D-alanyl-lipoteichoic acid acyltransferase DltB (MBOAT superfamily)
MLLVASYIFYGYIHPWFCFLLAASTIVDYFCGLALVTYPGKRKLFLVTSLVFNLGMLGVFKYFNFFAENVGVLIRAMGFSINELTLSIFLPVGISFYTFQTLSYTIDIYRGRLKPTRNFIDFGLFVSMFPQLVAGPIERAVHLLPQIQTPRKWDSDRFVEAWPLLIRGYLKKIVLADHLAVYVDKVFMLDTPDILTLTAGTIAFSFQIYADFSAYTDIARGSAKLFGFDLMENFRSPYLAITPSDFWRRWHISFSSWIRDYLYIPLGGSRVNSKTRYFFILAITFILSGFWHGASWNFIVWGGYHAIVLFIYHQLGLTGGWSPQGKVKRVAAWAVMTLLTMVSWAIFRSPDVTWLTKALCEPKGLDLDSLTVALIIVFSTIIYSIPLFFLLLLDRLKSHQIYVRAICYGIAIVLITLFHSHSTQDFIYFQF